MSAKWRRHKKTAKRFNIFNVFNKNKDKNVRRTFRVKTPNLKRNTRSTKYKVENIPEEKMKDPPRLIDIIEEGDEIAVFAELAGFDKESLKISVKTQRLSLSAHASERKYHKSLNLPKRVIQNTMHMTYKNGVLAIRLKKAVEEKAINNKIAG